MRKEGRYRQKRGAATFVHTKTHMDTFAQIEIKGTTMGKSLRKVRERKDIKSMARAKLMKDS